MAIGCWNVELCRPRLAVPSNIVTADSSAAGLEAGEQSSVKDGEEGREGKGRKKREKRGEKGKNEKKKEVKRTFCPIECILWNLIFFFYPVRDLTL